MAFLLSSDIGQQIQQSIHGGFPNNAKSFEVDASSGHVVGTVLWHTVTAFKNGQNVIYNIEWKFTGLPSSKLSIYYMLDVVNDELQWQGVNVNGQ